MKENTKWRVGEKQQQIRNKSKNKNKTTKKKSIIGLEIKRETC